ncbi:sterile alpha motif domain-containing protein 3-like [Astyanax mexicanus]|uniref:Sterile alpha motif domain-containing protein 3-like n=1 Tax=Astyanax mexicanus TaxID=7994 RepID=A0A8T2M7I3_ASTMX|nr:sterile alpha motif domain-containing protein 3-like [Astyanax mexicanus]
MKVLPRKGGVAGQKIKNIFADVDKNDAIETRRACVLKALIVYLNEDPENLIREYLDVAEFECRLTGGTNLGVFLLESLSHFQ